MPILPSIQTKRISQAEFGELAYEVMRHVFAIHEDFGRFFDEKVYKKELAARIKNMLLEVPVDVTHDTFTKRYFADAIVASFKELRDAAASPGHAVGPPPREAPLHKPSPPASTTRESFRAFPPR